MPVPIPPPRSLPAPDRPVHAIICGVLIVLAALAMMFTQTHRQGADRPHGIGIQFDLYAHIVVALMQGPHDAAMESAALATLKKMAKTPDERVAYAIVAREVHHAKRADDVTGIADPNDRPAPGAPPDAVAPLRWAEVSKTPATELKKLEDRYGWYAKLEESRGEPATDPLRQQVLRQARHPLIVGAVAFGVGGFLALAGVVLLVLTLVQIARRKWLLYFRQRAMDVSYLEAFTLYLCVFAGISLVTLFIAGKLGWQVSGAIYLLAIVLLFWPRFRRAISKTIGAASWPEWRTAVGLIAPRGVWREIAAGIFGYVAGIPVIIIGLAVSSILIKLSGADATHPIVYALRGPLWIVLLVGLLACVYAPIVEELFFRGILLGYLRQCLSWWIAAPLVALLFAAIHPQGWAAIPALGSIALVLCAIREWRGSILGCMAAHALNNGIVLTIALLMLR